jgi:hypothetical protein
MGFSRNSRKRAIKTAQDRALIDANNRIDPHTEQILNRVELDGSSQMRGNLLLQDGEKPSTGLAAAPTEWVDAELVEVGKDIDDVDTNVTKLKNEVNNKADKGDLSNDAKWFAHHHDIGSALSGSYRHSHSMSSTTFIKRTKEERREMLRDRADLLAFAEAGKFDLPQAVLARNVENLLSLLMDYRDLDAFEREELLEDPEYSMWADDYKKVYGMDEYAEEDRHNYNPYDERLRMDIYKGIARIVR